MVTFELSEILKNTGLSSIDIVDELADKLSMQTYDYISNTKYQTTGIFPTYGDSVASLPASDLTAFFISDAQEAIQAINNEYIPMIYSNTVWQLMIATQIVPVGWLYNNSNYAKTKYEQLYKTWNLIVTGKRVLTTMVPIYQYMNAFGLMVRRISGHKEGDLVFFVIYDNETNYSQLLQIIKNNRIDNIVLMKESEYLKNLSNELYYDFTVRFDKVTMAHGGTMFKASTNLRNSVPLRKFTVGSANVVTIYKSATDTSKNPHLANIDFKSGADVAVTVQIPDNYKIHLISLNGTTYFRDTIEMDKAGISILEDLSQTSYIRKGVRNRVYQILFSGLTTDSKLYIGACECQSENNTSKSMVSDTSSVTVSETDTSLNIIFNRPFIFLDTSKIKIWAKKDDESEEELVTGVNYIMGDVSYRERQALFSNDVETGRPPQKPHHKPSHHDHYHEHPWDKDRPNPNVHYSKPMGNYPVMEPAIVSQSIPYGVLQYTSIIATFDNYVDYKYFRLEFEPEAMIAVYEAPGIVPIDIIPYIEDALLLNLPEEDIPSDTPEENNPSDVPEENVPIEGEETEDEPIDSESTEEPPVDNTDTVEGGI